VDTHFSAEVVDSVAVPQRRRADKAADPESGYDLERVVLFLMMAPGKRLDQDLEGRIRAKIRTQLSPRHVPAVVMEIGDIPVSRGGRMQILLQNGSFLF